jgi:3-deoxy-D-manno-octulosonic-acid transferase
VGGGFGRGIHNILEPATWGVPVLFGPNHEKFREALNLIYLGGAKSFSNYDEFRSVLEDLSENPAFYERSSLAASEYVRENAGATKKIMEWISSEVINSI